MECWEKYNKLLMPLPYKTGWTEHPVRVLNPEQWKKTEKNDILEYETKIIRENKDTGERLFLRFQRAGCKAWLYENGELLGDHYGSFTEWQEELKASGDLESEIRLVLKGDEGNLSPFEKAGLFGDVFLVSLPEIFLKDVRIDTDYQEGWKLKVAVEADFGRRKEAVQLCVLLTDAENKKHLVYEEWEIAPENAETELVLNMSEVQPWSTENPVLYELTLQLFQGKEFLEEYQTKIGFRRIERKGNQIFWNEVPLKLRGICYREPLGEEGHFLETDLRLFKEAGINYMRSLFYPFSEKALEICDRLGILTEQSASVYKVGKGCRASQDLPDCRRLYGEQFSELLKSSRNHVSVLLWSLGSESIWGRNFFLCAQMAEALAPKQLLNFSYPMTIPKEEAIQMDVWSVLYADWKQPLDKMYDHMEIGHANVCDNEIGYVTGHTYREIRPVLHEIYAHLPCYNRDQILRDYGIHEFWGESLVRFQKSMEKTEGALGGSVMAGYDEDGSFSWLLEGCEWGILDSDHRPKPEYYHLKMVFSGQKPQCLEGIAVEAQREKEERRSVKKIFGKDYKIAEDDSFVIREEQENYLCLEENQGIELYCFEVLDKDGNVYLDNLREAKAAMKYTFAREEAITWNPTFTYMGFQYALIVSYPGQPKVENFTACTLHSDMSSNGMLECSNPLLNQLHHNFLWGLKSNFLDVPTDCPQRDERLGWTGDAQIFCRTATYLMNTYTFYKKWLRDLEVDQTPEGGVPHVIPNIEEGRTDGNWLLSQGAHSAAAWADAAIINTWTMYLMYGDKAILERQYKSMKGWIDFMHAHAVDYIWNYKLQFGDWVALDAEEGSYFGATPNDLTCTAYYAYSTGLFAKMAKVLGKEDVAAEYEALYQKIVNKFQETFFDAEGNMTAQTQTAHIVALYFQLTPKKYIQKTVEGLKRLLDKENGHLVTGFVGTPYFCHALSQNHCLNEAYDLLLKEDFPSWLYQVKKGATTIWEHWDGMKDDGSMWSADMNSFNHYAYGAIGEWMYRAMAGIEADSENPGFKHAILYPRIGGNLKYTEGTYHSIYGKVGVRWETDGNQITLTVEIPVNTTAEIRLDQAKAVKENDGLVFKAAEDYMYAETGSGVYKIVFEQ